MDVLQNLPKNPRSDLPPPDLESYSVTMRALGEAAARRGVGEGAEAAEGWRQALQLLEELREWRLSANTRMLGGKCAGKSTYASEISLIITSNTYVYIYIYICVCVYIYVMYIWMFQWKTSVKGGFIFHIM